MSEYAQPEQCVYAGSCDTGFAQTCLAKTLMRN